MEKKIMLSDDNNITLNQVIGKINSIENRLSKIEQSLVFSDKTQNINPQLANEETNELEIEEENPLFESGIFEHGLAWLGSIILSFGMIFLISLGRSQGGSLIAAIIGVISASAVLFFSHYLRNTFASMSFTFKLSAYFLLYYTIIKMYFFTTKPLIPFLGIDLFLILILIGFQFYLASKRKSEFLALFSVTLLILTGIFCNSTHISLSLSVIAAIIVLYFFNRFAWSRLLIFSLFLIYIPHIIWLLGNPIMNHPAKLMDGHDYNLIYLFLYGAIFSIVPFVRQKESNSNEVYAAGIIINGLNFSLVLSLAVFSYFKDSYIAIFLGISAVCLIYSILLYYKIKRKFDSSFFACFSFMALSVAVFGYAKLPGSFMFLALQSFLVLLFSIWYRSKIIVVMNILLFISLLFAYLISSPSINHINFSFAFTALFSAWIINWQKDRLCFKSNTIQNIYLIFAFSFLLYALYRAIPKNYIAMSWTLTAVFYMILNLIFKDKNYRWMALFAFLFTVIYLFIVDMAHFDTVYRVVAFLFLALIIFGVSIFYTKKLRKSKEQGNMLEREVLSD